MSKKRQNKPNSNDARLAASANGKQLIVNQITITPVRRGVLDVQDWRDAIRNAESESGNRTKLYDLLDDIMLDTHVSAEYEKRTMAITNSDIVFMNGKGELVDEINDLIDTPEFEDMLTEISLTKRLGITLLDFEPGIKKFVFNSIPRKHIRPKTGMVVFDQYSDVGIPYREGTNANWVIELGKPDDLGTMLKVAFWVIIKRGGIGDFAQFAELFGMPTRIGEYDAFDEASRIELEKAMKEMGSAAYILKPKGTEVTLQENNTNSDGSLYEKLISICDKAISTFILGQTLTTIDKSGSGFAQSTIHQETKEEIIQADKRYVRRILNKNIKKMLENLGYPVEDGKFSFRDAVPVANRKAEVELIQKVKDSGVPVDDDYVYEKSGIPKPDNYDELKQELKEKAKVTEPVDDPQTKKKLPIKKSKDKKLSWSERLLQFRETFKGFFQ